MLHAITPYIESVMTIAVIHGLAVVSPGPDFAMILRNSLVYSKRSGLMAALGITTGILMHATYTLLGVGVLIQNSPVLFKTIQCAGAAYLIYMGWKSFWKKDEKKEEDTFDYKALNDDLTLFQAFRTGFLSNALNPMVIVLFVSVFSSVIEPGTPFSVQAFYAVEMVIITFAWFGLVALFFSHDIIRTQFQKMGHWLNKITGGVLFSLGIKIVLMAAKL